MIAPIRYFWQQFNGPQISCITKAVFEWLKKSFDSLLDFFEGWSVSTVTNEQLTTVGALMDIGRPVVRHIESTEFFFTATVHGEGGHNSPHGFSGIPEPVGGVFAETFTRSGNAELLQADYYRAILKAVQTSAGSWGSLILLEDIANALNEVNNMPIFTRYTFSWYTEPEGRNGDVLLQLGNVSDWARATYVLAAIESVAKDLYGPEPAVYGQMEPT